MKAHIITSIAVLCLASIASADVFGTGVNEFTIDFVTISGDASSANGTGIGFSGKTFADPGHAYRMGVYEISNNQWDKFAASLGVPVTGGPASAYEHSAYFTGADVPTNNISWNEAAQFVNWLNTSTGHHAAYKFTGTQGTGDYTLDIWNAVEADNTTNLYRHKDAFYFLPTEDEWVKAAYWNGTALQTYGTPGDSVPTESVDANFGNALGEPWDVGSGSEEINGTFDMMANVWEWTESPYSDPSYGTDSHRCLRGGSYYYDVSILASSYRNGSGPFYGISSAGFRVASEVPEPCSLGLLSLGGVAILRRRRVACPRTGA